MYAYQFACCIFPLLHTLIRLVYAIFTVYVHPVLTSACMCLFWMLCFASWILYYFTSWQLYIYLYKRKDLQSWTLFKKEQRQKVRNRTDEKVFRSFRIYAQVQERKGMNACIRVNLREEGERIWIMFECVTSGVCMCVDSEAIRVSLCKFVIKRCVLR